jgi:hypothetical protein
VIRPEQYARTIEQLTGFRWIAIGDRGGCENEAVKGEGTRCWGPVDLATTDFFGFRAMSGGINGYYSTAPTHTFTPPKDLVMGRYAADAAGFVVDHDFADPDEATLLTISGTSAQASLIREQLAVLHGSILGELVGPHSPAVDASYTLFRDRLERDGSLPAAWKLTITALLQDVRMVFY